MAVLMNRLLLRSSRSSISTPSPLFLSSLISRSLTSVNCEASGFVSSSCKDILRTDDPEPIVSRGVVTGGGIGGRNIHWVFLGCPGVGKGTYASRLSNLLGVPHIATGDLVRQELASSGPFAPKLADIVNQGHLVPDEIIFDLLSKHLQAGESRGESGFILDGFPRTVRQAEILEGVTEIDMVLNLKLREEALIAKCLGRRICSECGGNYNTATIDIKSENGRPGMYMAPLLPPPDCETKLITRSDDREDIVKERLRVYNEMTQPVEDFYRSRGKLLEFDLPGGIPESWSKLLLALNLDELEGEKSATA